MEWKEEYAIGVEEIDKEHQGLFKAVNRLSHVLKEWIRSGTGTSAKR